MTIQIRKNRKKSVNHRSAKFLVNIDFQVLAVNCIFIFNASGKHFLKFRVQCIDINTERFECGKDFND